MPPNVLGQTGPAALELEVEVEELDVVEDELVVEDDELLEELDVVEDPDAWNSSILLLSESATHRFPPESKASP